MPALRTPQAWTKDVVRTMVNACGFEVTRYPPPATLEHHLTRLLRVLDIDCILDVGAHYGEYRHLLRQLGYKGLIISFEPVKESFNILKRAAGDDPQWRGVNVALSDHDGDGVMNLYSNSFFNSLHQLKDSAKPDFGVQSDFAQREAVTLRRLDSVLEEHLPDLASRRIFLKLDTQGHDTVVVRGAERLLPSILGIQSELSAVRIYDGTSGMQEALQLYMGYGFVPTFFMPVNTFESTLVSPEWDVVLRRTPVD